jgi:hypothetical protein
MNIYTVETKRFDKSGKCTSRGETHYSSLKKARASMAMSRRVFDFDYEMKTDCDVYRPESSQMEMGYTFIVRQIVKADVF